MRTSHSKIAGNATITVLLIIMLIMALGAVILTQSRQSARFELARAITRSSEADLGSKQKRARIYLEHEISDLLRAATLDRADSPWPLSSTSAAGIPVSAEVVSGTENLRSEVQRAAAELCSQKIAVFVSNKSQCDQAAPALEDPGFVEGSVGGWQRYRIPYAVLTWNDEKRRTVQGAFTVGVGKRATFGFALALTESRTKDGDPVALGPSTALEGDVYIGQVPRIQGTPLIAGSLESSGCRDGDNPCVSGPGAVTFPFGTVASAALRPSSQHPCYGEDCPRIRGGLDLSAAALPPSLPTLPSSTLRLAGNTRLKLGTDDNLQRIEACAGDTGVCAQYRVQGNALERLSNGTWTGLQNWDQVIYIDGALETLSSLSESAAIAPGSQISIVARGDARIVGSLYYSVPPCAGYLTGEDNLAVSNCANLGSRDLLSVTSLRGDVIIGNGASPATQASRNLSVSAALYAPEGTVGVENARSHAGGGQFNLLGAIRARYSSNWGSLVARLQFDPRLERTEPPGFANTSDARSTVGVQ